jgi:hypothetical protein
MYGEKQYGIIEYAAETGNEDEAYYEDLTKLVPPVVTRLKEMYELYHSEGYEIGQLYRDLRDMEEQCFIATATWGLDKWEKLFGINTDISQTYEERREILVAKLCGQGTTTKQMIENTASVFSGGDVTVIEKNEENRFVIRFIGVKGIPRNMQGMIDMIEEIKPAHLAYSFEYRYTIWNELNGYTWNGLNGRTWSELRTMMEERNADNRKL